MKANLTISWTDESDGSTGWWQLKYFLEFSPRKLGKMNPIWRSYFFKGVGSTTNQKRDPDLWTKGWPCCIPERVFVTRRNFCVRLFKEHNVWTNGLWISDIDTYIYLCIHGQSVCMYMYIYVYTILYYIICCIDLYSAFLFWYFQMLYKSCFHVYGLFYAHIGYRLIRSAWILPMTQIFCNNDSSKDM